jgi:arginine/lysine/ornithine decarboxylase
MVKMPLFAKILEHCEGDRARFHIPGHRQGMGLPRELREVAPEFYKMDLTEVPGLDDLHNPEGVIAEAQKLASRLYGAGDTFFLVNGTTCGLQALILSTAGENERVLVPRNAHRSVLGGLILSGAVPEYLQPEIIPHFEIAGAIPLDELKEKMSNGFNYKAVLALHPTYYGTVGDLTGLVDEAHKRDLPVIVDEAHGTHLYFHRQTPRGALRCGADGVVQSVHKTGGSFTQSSWLHLQGNLINKKRLKDALRLVQTTSPSYILLASLDAARFQLAEEGKQIMERTLELAIKARRSISEIKGLVLLDEKYSGKGLFHIDPTRLVISVKGLGLTGFQVKEILSSRYRVELEMADLNNIVAVISLGTTPEDVHMLVEALRDLSTGQRPVAGGGQRSMTLPPIPPLGLSPRKAWMAGSRGVKLEEAIGSISGEMVCVYPPGIPVICPGEEITREVYDYLRQVRKLKLHCQGPEDPELNTVRIIDH